MMPHLTTCTTAKKRVFLRIDGNVPIRNGVILDDFRLRAVIPTLRYLSEQQAHITIGTHLGRPHGYEKDLSTAPLAGWFVQRGFDALTVLENLRFDPREVAGDLTFARELAAEQDVYITDAWGALHRNDTSITLLPTLFKPENRALGFLVEREIRALNPLCTTPKIPYLIFLGGGKPKFEVIKELIEQQRVTTLVLLPGLVFTFLAARGIPIGASLVFPEHLETCKIIEQLAQQHAIKLIIPDDFIVEDRGMITTSRDILSPTARGITIGPRTMQNLKEHINNAQTIFYNGAMGYGKEGERVFEELLSAIAASSAETVIGGGDSIAAVEQFGLVEKYTWCSTGGGSTLAFISGKELPGLRI